MKNSASAASWPKRKPNRSSNSFCSNHSSERRVEGHGLDVADRDQAVEVLAAHSGCSMNLKGIAEEAQALPSGELAEIDRGKRFKLALIQAAATDAAGHVAERFAGVDQPVGDSVLGRAICGCLSDRRCPACWSRSTRAECHRQHPFAPSPVRPSRSPRGRKYSALTYSPEGNPYCYCNSIASCG